MGLIRWDMPTVTHMCGIVSLAWGKWKSDHGVTQGSDTCLYAK